MINIGKSDRLGLLEQFSLTVSEMRLLADSLLESAASGKDLFIQLGDRVIQFTYGLEMGVATLRDDRTLIFRSNRVDLKQLAIDLQDLSGVPEDERYKHIHLEPALLDSSETVSDIVFEFQ